MRDRISMKTLLQHEMDRSKEIVLADDDVLCGRGKHSCHHPGNVQFLKVVSYFKELYSTSDNQAQLYITEGIIKMLKNRSPPVRFVYQDERKRGVWYEIPHSATIEKTRQALRKKTTPKWAKLGYHVESSRETSPVKQLLFSSKSATLKNTSITENQKKMQGNSLSSNRLHQSKSSLVDLTFEPGETFSSNVPFVAPVSNIVVNEPNKILRKVETSYQHPSINSFSCVSSNIMKKRENMLGLYDMPLMNDVKMLMANDNRLRIEREKFTKAFSSSRSDDLKPFQRDKYYNELLQLYHTNFDHTNAFANGPAVIKSKGNNGKLRCSKFMHQIIVESLTSGNLKRFRHSKNAAGG